MDVKHFLHVALTVRPEVGAILPFLQKQPKTLSNKLIVKKDPDELRRHDQTCFKCYRVSISLKKTTLFT